MKKIFPFFLSLLLIFSLAGCAQVSSVKTTSVSPSKSEAAQTTTGSDTSSTVAETTAASNIDLSGVTLHVGAAYDIQAFLKAAGLDDTPYKVDANVFQGGNLVLEAMAANQLDLGSGSQIPPIFASQAANGGNMKIIAIRKGSTLDQELVIPAGSGIKTVADLKGKKVAYIKSTTAHYFLAKMLEQAGLAWSDVETVAMTTSDGLTALLTNEVAAFASYGNSITTAHQKGATTLASAENILSGDYYFYATPEAIADPATHAAIVDYLNRFNEANEWTRQHAEEWASISAPSSNQDPADFLTQFKREVAQRYRRWSPSTMRQLPPNRISSIPSPKSGC
jgi:sulfonate transport system substrate-binding protein